MNSLFEHVEMYVGDARQTAYYFTTAFGFAVATDFPAVARPDCYSVALRQGAIRLIVTSALRPSHPAASYFALHGDGVADIAFRVPDVRQAFHNAIANGFTAVAGPAASQYGSGSAVVAKVAGAGGVVHSLVQYDREAERPGRGTRETGPAADPRFRAIDHFAMITPAGSLAEVVAGYRKAFGFDQVFEDSMAMGGEVMKSAVVRSPCATVTFTIIEPGSDQGTGQLHEFLASHPGAGIQHIALQAGSITAAVRACTESGVEFLAAPRGYYDEIEGRVGPLGDELAELRSGGVLADRDEWGLLLQVFTRSPYARQTLFYEIIERRGGRTFGSGNIRSLYESVARVSGNAPG